ncbi:carbamoyl-phosphate synthase L chain, ATP binding domain-containing protein [Gorgonomyces haynaldii]|nr:carbamoyl-phosphate synthase L chain, ATP binding domain-containing protein [Gorgonomyces haynaldii]
MISDKETLLVANRGEIAIRVIRAAHQLGLKTVSIYSHEDRLSMHRYKAQESFQIAPQGDVTPVGAYLAMDRILDIALKRQVSVIHPGYGFLSENAQFAQKVQDAGIAFCGPSPQVIDACGDKTKARELAKKANVPVVPGSGPIADFKDAQSFIDQYGFPVIIKAAFGGGGRGMRVVRDQQSLPMLFERAQSEALSAFGDGTVFLERFIERPRHIEVQLLADKYGNCVHLFERDCSVQRRHQKVVEMGPSLNLKEETRKQILEDAVKLAKQVGYSNAGTAEFLVDQQQRHYFIEINPRVQVEHTVTEEITGIDIVSAQIQIALGKSLESLGLVQDKISVRGFAIQCRVTTEDPSKNFQPDTGRIELYRSPAGNGVRLDGGPGYSGAIITPFYDSLLTKCTCLGIDFESARRKMLCALSEFRVRGLKTNIKFVIGLLQHPTFRNGSVWTTFVDDTPELFESEASGNTGQRLLQYLADLSINGPRIVGQKGLPQLQTPIVVPETEKPLTSGWRDILLQGPEAFCKAARNHKGLLLMDTTWRDAHQSLLATRVRTLDLCKIADTTARVFNKLFALECWGGATFDVSMRFLYECPWDRLKKLRQLVPNVPFQMLLRGANAVGYTSYPDNVVYAFCKKAKECGVDIFRVFDSLNYTENLKLGIDAVKAAGGIVEGVMSYTGDVSDPTRTKYNLEYYLNLTQWLVDNDVHIVCIKDMAGLLKPRAAKLLIGSIRERFPDLVIHVHTHDTASTGLASMIQCAEAGADVVDVAIDSMSGLTSQPCMGALVSALEGTDLDTGLLQEDVMLVNTYWEQMRLQYSCFDPNVKSADSGVYLHEMPGGQYTNLLFQSQELGLGSQWQQVKLKYREANLLLGDITKVTPSSKVVGDLAQMMVSQQLSMEQVVEKAETLSFPQSVLEYFQGYLGQPPYGFPEPLRTRILEPRNLKRIEGRPGACFEPLDLQDLKTQLTEKYGHIEDTDVLSSALYPKVFEDFMSKRTLYGDLSVLPTKYFLTPMSVGQEFSFDVQIGKTLIIKLLAIGPLHEETGKRDVYFSINGEARMVSVVEEGKIQQLETRKRANPSEKGDIGAPMSGMVVEVRLKQGSSVKLGDPIAVLSAMKMETIVTATKEGIIETIEIKTGDSLNAGDLIAQIA